MANKGNSNQPTFHKPDLDRSKSKRKEANQQVLQDGVFLQACEAMGIKPTKRQASKYRHKRGLAYKYGRNS